MSADPNKYIPEIMSVVSRADALNKNRSDANLIIELATLRLLIDAKITTAEAAIQQIEKTRDWLSLVFPPDEIGRSIDRAIEFLRARETEPKPEPPLLAHPYNLPSKDQSS